ncbi:MAG: hypothetical protein MUP76_00635 [Acidimicrobiia bacterium]|nr:hypothetical protein [Acidimicrobiia bacterium]
MTEPVHHQLKTGWAGWPEWAMLTGVVVATAALWLPWHQSGGGVRSAFELSDTAVRLDLGPASFAAVMRWLVAVVPVLAAVVWLTRLRNLRTMFRASSAAVALVVGISAVVVIVVAGPIQIGTAVGLVGSAVTVAGLGGEWWRCRRSRDDGRAISPGEDA